MFTTTFSILITPSLWAHCFNLIDDSATLVSMEHKDLSSTLVHSPGCTNNIPATSIPKYMPYIDDRIYYIFNYDNNINLGVKSFPLTINP